MFDPECWGATTHRVRVVGRRSPHAYGRSIVTAAHHPGRGAAWTSKVGAWIGLGASPGALLLGAGLAERHGGPIPVLGVVIGVLSMAVLLWCQGLLGLQPPAGENGTLSRLSRVYFSRRMQRTLGGVLAVGMIGWFGFNVGIGGAAIGALFGLPQIVGPLLLGLPCLVLATGGLRRWNATATIATLAALALTVMVVIELSARTSPVTLGGEPGASLLTDVSAYVGYVAIFSVRAPDFSVGLATRRDLAWCVAALCVPVLLVGLAGVGLQMGTGTSDLVGVLAGSGMLAIGNLLIALAVVGPTLTTLYSGSLALDAAIGLPHRRGMVAVAVLGLALAIARFDRQFIGWLIVLSVTLPPLVVPMAVEATRRRRGGAHRVVPLWSWLPGSVIAVALMIAGIGAAPVVGLVVAGALTVVWMRLG